MQRNYIDYLWSKDSEHRNFTINNKIGSSDHLSLSITITAIKRLKAEEAHFFNTKYVKEETKKILEELQ